MNNFFDSVPKCYFSRTPILIVDDFGLEGFNDLFPSFLKLGLEIRISVGPIPLSDFSHDDFGLGKTSSGQQPTRWFRDNPVVGDHDQIDQRNCHLSTKKITKNYRDIQGLCLSFFLVNLIQFNSIYFQIPNACTTKISQFMKYSYVRESLWYNTK